MVVDQVDSDFMVCSICLYGCMMLLEDWSQISTHICEHKTNHDIIREHAYKNNQLLWVLCEFNKTKKYINAIWVKLTLVRYN